MKGESLGLCHSLEAGLCEPCHPVTRGYIEVIFSNYLLVVSRGRLRGQNEG